MSFHCLLFPSVLEDVFPALPATGAARFPLQPPTERLSSTASGIGGDNPRGDRQEGRTIRTNHGGNDRHEIFLSLKAMEDRVFLDRVLKRVCSPLSLLPACSFLDMAAKRENYEELAALNYLSALPRYPGNGPTRRAVLVLPHGQSADGIVLNTPAGGIADRVLRFQESPVGWVELAIPIGPW